LQIPYDILNRLNRKKLHKQNNSVSTNVKMDDYFIDTANNTCLDLFVVAQKKKNIE
jgi:hypothetical protein